MKMDELINIDCMEYMKTISDNYVNLTLTDIPYDGVNRDDNGLRKLDKGKADIITFDMQKFLDEIYRITSNTIIIFCGQGQLSQIFTYFLNKQYLKKGSVRQIVWRKTNPSPMNGDKIYLSGVENAVWFKKSGGYLMLFVKILFSIIQQVQVNFIPQKRIMVYCVN